MGEPSHQRWANSVLMTEYEYEYYSASQKWPNTNTNIIRFPKNYRIQIRILFGFLKMTEYEYEYYSVSQKWPNTNIIRLSKKDRIRIRILFGFPKMTENKYYSDSQKYIAEKSQTNANSRTAHAQLLPRQSKLHPTPLCTWCIPRNVHDGLSVVAEMFGIIQLRGWCLNTLWCQIFVRRSKIYHEPNTRCKTNKIVWWFGFGSFQQFRTLFQ